MEVTFIELNAIDKIRLLATNINDADFIGMLAPKIRDKVNDGQSFWIKGDPSGRLFTYVIQDGEELIRSSSGNEIKLSKGRSLTGVLMDKITNNQFSKTYRDMKKNYSDMLNFVEGKD